VGDLGKKWDDNTEMMKSLCLIQHLATRIDGSGDIATHTFVPCTVCSGDIATHTFVLSTVCR
jgi:hypothetical protein